MAKGRTKAETLMKTKREKKEELTGRKCRESSGLPALGEKLIIVCIAVVGSKALSVKAP